MTENAILEKIPNIIFKKELLIVNTKSLSVCKLCVNCLPGQFCLKKMTKDNKNNILIALKKYHSLPEC